MNVNLLKYNLATNVTNYSQNIRSAGCQSFIDIPTRVCIKTNRCEISCLDHLYSNVLPNLMETYVIRSGISDHFATLAKVNCNINTKSKNVAIMKRKTKLTNEEIIDVKSDLGTALHTGAVHYDRVCPNVSTAHLVATYQKLETNVCPGEIFQEENVSFTKIPGTRKVYKLV